MDFNDLDMTQKYNELVRVFETMERYNRTNGWMRWDGDIMRFYDGKVDDGCYIELSWLKLWISEFWNRYSK
jgi:hypothetical protein